MILAYWKIRGLAQPIRLLLEYTQTPYENKYYEVGQAPQFDRSAWLGEKYKLGLTFPNLPYLVDPRANGLKLTQSNAILFYVAQQNKLAGDTPAETAVINMILGYLYDLRDAMGRSAYHPNYESFKADFFNDTMKRRVAEIESFLADGRKWAAGAKLTVADFVLYEVMNVCREMNTKALTSAPKVQEHQARFESLPEIAAYLKSDRFFAHPINNLMASFK